MIVIIDVPLGQDIPDYDTDLYIWKWMRDRNIEWKWNTYERLSMPDVWVLRFKKEFDL